MSRSVYLTVKEKKILIQMINQKINRLEKQKLGVPKSWLEIKNKLI